MTKLVTDGSKRQNLPKSTPFLYCFADDGRQGKTILQNNDNPVKCDLDFKN